MKSQLRRNDTPNPFIFALIVKTCLTMEDRRRRQLYKKVNGVDGLQLPRQERVSQLRKLKKLKELAKSRAVLTLSAVGEQLKKDREVRSVLQTLLSLPNEPTAQVGLNHLCETRPLDLVSAGALPILIEALKMNDEYMKERATWCLAKLAEKDMEIRNRIIQEFGALYAIKQTINYPHSTVSFGLSKLHLMTGFLNHKSMPSVYIAAEWHEFVTKLVSEVDPENDYFDTVVQALVTVSYISKYPEAGFSDRVVTKLVAYLGHEKYELVEPSLTALGNAVTRSIDSIQVALDAGVLEHIQKLLQNVRTKANTCILMANIAAGTPQQLQMLFKPCVRKNFEEIAKMVCGDHPRSLKLRALSVLVAVMKNGKDIQIVWMDEMDCTKALCQGLQLACEESGDVHILVQVLLALTNVIEIQSSHFVEYRPKMEERGVVVKVTELKEHSDEIVRTLSVSMIEKYFTDAAPQQENVAPTNNTAPTNNADGPKVEVSVGASAPARGATFGTISTTWMNTEPMVE